MPPIRKTTSAPPPMENPRAGGGRTRVSRRPPRPTPEDEEEDFEEDEEEDFEETPQMDGGRIDADDLDFDDDPASTFGGNPDYNQAVSKGQYIRVHFIKPLKEHIKNSTLMPDTKATLVILAEGLFDKTQVLAKRKNLKLSEINMEIIIAQARIGFHPSDVDNPDLANIVNLIKETYIAFISRSENGWERELDNRMETSHTNRVVDDRNRMPMMQQQRGNYPVWHPRRWF